MNKKNNNNKISTYIVNKTEENKNDNKKQNNFNGYLNDFSSYPGTEWYERQGKPTYNTTTGVWDCSGSGSSSGWFSDGFANNGNSGAASVTIQSNYTAEWLISPIFDLSNGTDFVVSCDAATTEAYSVNALNIANWKDDDWAALFMTSDKGLTWTKIYTWDNTNNPGSGTSTGDISISGYSNINYSAVQFGFYAESTNSYVPNERLQFFIDNFKISNPNMSFCSNNLVENITNLNLTTIIFADIQATVTWESSDTSFIVDVIPFNDQQGTISGFTQTTTDKSISLTGLPEQTGFHVFVRSTSTTCDSNTFSIRKNATSFTIVGGDTYLNDFRSYPGDGWYERQGIPTYNDDGTWNCTLSGTASRWGSDGFGNDGTTGSARMNIWNTGRNEWLISPIFDLNNGAFVFSCDAAATEWNSTADAIWGADDKAVLFMTSNGGSTWIELYRWHGGNNPGADGTPTGDIFISGYSNIDSGNVQFGFYAESTQANEDIDFFIDNFRVVIADGVGDEDAGPITGTVDPHNSLAILTPDLLGPNNGDASINTDGIWSYTPNPNFNGKDTFTITIDGSTVYKELKIIVYPVNDAATITGDISGFYRGQPVTGQLSVTDNVDGFTNGTFSITEPTYGNASIDDQGNWIYTPDINFMDTDTFTVLLTDDENHIEDQTITIIGALSGDNTGVIDEDNGQVTGKLTFNSAYTATHSIANADPFSVTQNAANGNANIDNEGNWSYTPNEHFYGTDTFIVTLTDDDNYRQTKTITITVNPLEDEPTITGDISGIYIGQPVTGQLTVTDVDGFTNDNRFAIQYGPNVQNIFSSGIKPDGWTTSVTTGDGWRFTGNPAYDASVSNPYNNKSVGTFAWVDFSGTDVKAILQTNTNSIPTGNIVIKFDFFSFNTTHNLSAYNELYLEIEDENGNWVHIGDPLADEEGSPQPFKRNTYSDRETQFGGWETQLVSYNNTNPNANIRFRAESGGAGNDFHNDLLISDVIIYKGNIANVNIDNDGNWTYTADENFDETDTFTVKITDDFGYETLQDITITKLIIISVKPYIISGNKADSILEHTGQNKIIYRAFAEDPDSDISDLTFYLDHTDEFTINKYTGEVTLIPNPVYAVKSEYTFSVYAKDKDGNTGYAKTVTLKIFPSSITLKQPNKNGLPQDDIIIQAKKGWKLIGTTTESILLDNELIVPRSIYTFKDGYKHIAYSEEDKGYHLEANKGIWIKLDW